MNKILFTFLLLNNIINYLNAQDEPWIPCANAIPPGPTSTWNISSCPINSTCGINLFSLSNIGCCPYTNAIFCNDFQCCPEDSTCILKDGSNNATDYHGVYTCQMKEMNITSKCTCKLGPNLPMSTTLKNVIIIGDSISIGYTPFVAEELSDIAQVIHAPWSSDGGSEEAEYTAQCLQYWLHSPSGIPYVPDLIWFNSGMHNSGQGADWIVPGQSGDPLDYSNALSAITLQLMNFRNKNPSVKLIFGITSPMLCNATIDNVITSVINPAAVNIMADAGLPTVDLHAAVVEKCGPVPTQSCFNMTGCFCPHCSNDGYQWLAQTTIAPAIRSLLMS